MDQAKAQSEQELWQLLGKTILPVPGTEVTAEVPHPNGVSGLPGTHPSTHGHTRVERAAFHAERRWRRWGDEH
ncbi:MAG: hypothetical protein J2P36_05170 [Ktedonobacteraceae bacterium]|nr:hypothetical protein [Ktedonobacteraceae bacterium]